MVVSQQYGPQLLTILNNLPADKALEIVNFAKFLKQRYGSRSQSQIDESSLLLQQKAMSEIWDDPEEDLYEL